VQQRSSFSNPRVRFPLSCFRTVARNRGRMAAPLSPVLIDVGELLGCCVELAEQAGVVIRAVNAKRVISGHTALKGVLKEGGNVRSWATTADDEAQHLIVGELRRRFPGIKVIGEEEEAEMLPILGGLLWKKGGGRRGRWKVRVFKLFPHKLEYSTPAGVKKGELLLAGHHVAITTSDVMASEGVRGAAKKRSSNIGPEGEHRFRLQAGPNSLVVGAKDGAVLSEWMRALHQLPGHGHVASFRLASGILTLGAGDVSDVDVGAGEKRAAAAPPAAANGNSLPAIPDALRAVPLEQVCIFVDPLDGTREFVEGRVHNSETLIGISVDNVAVAGAVGLPFWRRRGGRLEEWLEAGVAGTADTDGPVVVIAGVVGGGLGKSNQRYACLPPLAPPTAHPPPSSSASQRESRPRIFPPPRAVPGWARMPLQTQVRHCRLWNLLPRKILPTVRALQRDFWLVGVSCQSAVLATR
jgi:3'-phosphoadenosine 5'-phosphosulfate (PAPS) 3'-phosphatase